MLTSPYFVVAGFGKRAPPLFVRSFWNWTGQRVVFVFDAKATEPSVFVEFRTRAVLREGVARKKKYGIKGATGGLGLERERGGITWNKKNTKAGASGVGFFLFFGGIGRQGGLG